MARTFADLYREKLAKIKKRNWQRHHGETKKLQVLMKKPKDKALPKRNMNFKGKIRVKAGK